jgi:hypothetical protein
MAPIAKLAMRSFGRLARNARHTAEMSSGAAAFMKNGSTRRKT